MHTESEILYKGTCTYKVEEMGIVGHRTCLELYGRKVTHMYQRTNKTHDIYNMQVRTLPHYYC